MRSPIVVTSISSLKISPRAVPSARYGVVVKPRTTASGDALSVADADAAASQNAVPVVAQDAEEPRRIVEELRELFPITGREVTLGVAIINRQAGVAVGRRVNVVEHGDEHTRWTSAKWSGLTAKEVAERVSRFRHRKLTRFVRMADANAFPIVNPIGVLTNDARDALALAERMRTGSVKTGVYKAPSQYEFLIQKFSPKVALEQKE
jgi:hypothetical protein